MIGYDLSAQESDSQQNEEREAGDGAPNGVRPEQQARHDHAQDEKAKRDDERVLAARLYGRDEIHHLKAHDRHRDIMTALHSTLSGDLLERSAGRSGPSMSRGSRQTLELG
jgi:hypothetical protein